MEEAIKRLSADADAWLSYITLERFQGRNIPRCRSLYKRACDLVVKNIDQVVSSWLDFELDEGTPDEWKAAWTRGNKRLEEIETKRHNAEKKKQEEIESEKQKQREKQRARRERKRKRKEGTDDNDSAPDKVTQADDDKDSTHEAPPAKKAREDTTERSTINREEDRVNKRNEKTVHVSGLAKHAGEDDVRKFFSKYGEVMAVRMGKNKGTGEFAGYCFVEFSEPESAKAAIAAAASENKDDTDTTAATISDEAGLRVSVFKKRDPTKESVANNTNSTNRFEPRTLYLTNVSFKADKDVIRAFFNKGNCSGLKDIRIIRDLETGKSRGFAYIEFETDEDAEAALRMDKKPILGRAVKLRRSEAQQHPPEAYAQITQLQPNNDDKHLKQTPQVTLFKPRTLRNK